MLFTPFSSRGRAEASADNGSELPLSQGVQLHNGFPQLAHKRGLRVKKGFKFNGIPLHNQPQLMH